jgi:hypothetical protein
VRLAARPQQSKQGSRALAHYLPRPLYPAWIQGLEGNRLLGVHRRDPDPTRPAPTWPVPGAGRGGWHPPASSIAESHWGRLRT